MFGTGQNVLECRLDSARFVSLNNGTLSRNIPQYENIQSSQFIPVRQFIISLPRVHQTSVHSPDCGVHQTQPRPGSWSVFRPPYPPVQTSLSIRLLYCRYKPSTIKQTPHTDRYIEYNIDAKVRPFPLIYRVDTEWYGGRGLSTNFHKPPQTQTGYRGRKATIKNTDIQRYYKNWPEGWLSVVLIVITANSKACVCLAAEINARLKQTVKTRLKAWKKQAFCLTTYGWNKATGLAG